MYSYWSDWFFFSSSMLAILAFILRLPQEVRCIIWSFVVDVYVFDMAHEYSFVDPLGEVVRMTIFDLAYRPDRQLVYRISYNHRRQYKHDVGAHMSNLLKTYRKGKVKHVGTILRINLHTLFTSSRLFLGRAKKVIMIALQLHMVTQVEFQTWEYFSNDDDEHY